MLDERGQFRWHRVMALKLITLTINTADQQRLVTFYEALGLSFAPMKVTIGSEAYKATLPGFEFVIFGIKKNGNISATPNMALRFHVSNLDDVIAKVKEVPGCTVVFDPEAMVDGKMAILLDPDGHSVEIIQPW